jgi:hypothetical protein
MLIDNQTNLTVMIQAAGGTRTSILFSGEKVFVYCNGLDIYASCGTSDTDNVINKHFLTNSTFFANGSTLGSTKSTTFIPISNTLSFNNVAIGDYFDIYYSAEVITYGATNPGQQIFAPSYVYTWNDIAHSALVQTAIFQDASHVALGRSVRTSARTIFQATSAARNQYFNVIFAHIDYSNNTQSYSLMQKGSLIITQYRLSTYNVS